MFEINKKLETEIDLNGTIYPLKLSFDRVMNVLELMKSSKLNDLQKVQFGLKHLLGVVPDLTVEDLFRVFNGILEHFIRDEEREKEVDLNGDPMPVRVMKPTYDLKKDAKLIYVSFKQAYGIDLLAEQGKLDWRLFKIYLHELPDETRFKQVVNIRTQKLPTGKGVQKERERVIKLKRLYALPEEK